jgi:hypothetical protein
MHAIKYAGPKPIISHTGIDFDNNKEDKYVYINIAIQLLKALDHEYYEDKVYTYNAETHRLDENEMLDELKKYCPNLSELVDKEDHDIEEDIQNSIKRADENCILGHECKETLKNNIELMHDYLIQRSINKRVYYCVINKLAEMVQKDNIDYIVTPMFNKFAHVLHSLQGALTQGQRRPIDTDMEIYKDDGALYVKLKVINIVQ